MKSVGSNLRKRDSLALTTGQAVYADDLAPENCLAVKLLRSPHAHAEIEEIDVSAALNIPGVVAVYTYRDVPQARYTQAGQTYPEPSPYDRLILENRVRYVGDPVAIAAAEDGAAAEKALKAIHVKYRVLPAVFDPREALRGETVIHPEADWHGEDWIQGDPKRNLCASGQTEWGNFEAEMAACPHRVEHTCHTDAVNQVMTEPFCAFAQRDAFGRLCVTSSTQIPFHVRRILSRALQISAADIRVLKPRIGGGFGAKQTAVMEVYPAFVTHMTGRPAKLVFTRRECFVGGSPRHAMDVTVRLGADAEGNIRAIGMRTLSNTGAYGEHGPTTVGLTAEKAISLYGKLRAYRFDFQVAYTNAVSSGAYRGYGAPQGLLALETAVDLLAEKLGTDPMALRRLNLTRQGEIMPSYNGGSVNTSCALDACVSRAAEMFSWAEKPPRWVLPDGHIRAKGMALAMQGSGIAGVDTAKARIRLDEGGQYTLYIGAADMGTGCDTILAQMAADCLDCSPEMITVASVDTDSSPYDTGSYASSTTYVTGMAVVRAAKALTEKLREAAGAMLQCPADRVVPEGGRFIDEETGERVTLREIGLAMAAGAPFALEATGERTSAISPPPFMCGMAEIDIDPDTGKIAVPLYCAAVDCGTVINPALARVQAEGGIVQGMGMALTEQVSASRDGRLRTDSLMQYRIPSRLDVGEIEVDFVPSYEPEGPFGAKSIGEIVISTPAPAIVNALRAATGVSFESLPVLPWRAAQALAKNQN